MPTLFTKIIRGEIPSYKVYEDEHVYAFLDIRPIHLGHTLVVPKFEADHFTQVPEPYYGAVFAAAKKIGVALREATGCPRVGTAVVGFEVPHFHYHMVPIWSMTDLNFQLGKERPKAEMQAIQAKLSEILSRT